MESILNAFLEAFKLVFSFDNEIYGIIGLTLTVTILSTAVASLIGLPVGVLLGSRNFRSKKLFMRVVNTFMGLPPVVAGLVVYIVFSSSGPFGKARILFTPLAMIIAQIIIILPVVIGLTEAASRTKALTIEETLRGLQIKGIKKYTLVLHESRYAVVSALLTAYGRAISEVGAVMMVGGNIQYRTRVMTTAIVLETSKGNFDRALALGLILLFISFVINSIMQIFQEVKQQQYENNFAGN